MAKIVWCILAVAIWAFCLAHGDDGNTKTEQFEDFKAAYLHLVEDSWKTLQAQIQKNGISPAAIDAKLEKAMEKSLASVVEMVANLYTKVQVLSNTVSNLQKCCTKTDGLDSSANNAVNVDSKTGISNSSVDVILRKSDATEYSRISRTFVEGIIVAGRRGLFALSLTSSQETKLPCDEPTSVAFDWGSRKVYCRAPYFGLKRMNLGGTDVEFRKGHADALAFDPITGNFYCHVSNEVRVCSTTNGQVCSAIATNELDDGNIALHPSKGIMFWNTGSSLVRANMDGTNVTVIRSERVTHVKVDEDLDRVYFYAYTDTQTSLVSCDLDGKDRRVFRNFREGSGGFDIHGGVIFFNDKSMFSRGLMSMKEGGKRVSLIPYYGTFEDITLYGSKADYERGNPCETSLCSHLCVLKLESYACLCPEFLQLGQDGTTCVLA